MKLFDFIPKPVKFSPAKPAAVLIMLFTGAAMGVTAKLLDIYTENLGNIFSQMSVWIMLCTAISVKSKTPAQASLNVFLFCVGMTAAYYLTAVLTQSFWSIVFAAGWCAFAFLTPIFAFIVWYSAGKGVFAKIIFAAVLAVMLLSAVVLFDKIRISDVVFTAVAAAFMLAEKRG